MRTRRAARAGVLLVAAVLTLAACRTSPDVAAYVGDETVTVAELERAVADHRDDPAVTAGEDPAYTRTILSELVRTEIYDAAADHFGVDPDPGGIPELLEVILDGQDPDAYLDQMAAQGYSRADIYEQVRQVALLQAVAVAEGQAEEPTEEVLRAAYDEGPAGQPSQADLGLVGVPDQAAADATVAALQADPASYPTIAAAYPGPSTLPEPQTASLEALAAEAPDVADQVATTPAGGAFSTTVPGTPGVLVVLVVSTRVPTFQEARPQLEAAALSEAASAGAAILAEFEEDLDVTVNPRYGVLEDGRLVEGEGGVVEILGRTGDDAGGDGRGD